MLEEGNGGRKWRKSSKGYCIKDDSTPVLDRLYSFIDSMVMSGLVRSGASVAECRKHSAPSLLQRSAPVAASLFLRPTSYASTKYD